MLITTLWHFHQVAKMYSPVQPSTLCSQQYSRKVFALHDEWLIFLKGLVSCLAPGQLLELGTPAVYMQQEKGPSEAAHIHIPYT
jgi:hypothetical protein